MRAAPAGQQRTGFVPVGSSSRRGRLLGQHVADLLEFRDYVRGKQVPPAIQEDLLLRAKPFNVMGSIGREIEAPGMLSERPLLMPERQLLGHSLHGRIGMQAPATRLGSTLQPAGASQGN